MIYGFCKKCGDHYVSLPHDPEYDLDCCEICYKKYFSKKVIRNKKLKLILKDSWYKRILKKIIK